MKKLIFQSLLTIAGVSLLILPIAPVEAIAGKKFNGGGGGAPSGAAGGGFGRGGGRGGGAGSRGRSKTPSQSPNASNVPVAGVYPSLSRSPEYNKFVSQGFRSAPNGTQKVEINLEGLPRELRKIKQVKWYKVYRDGYVGTKKAKKVSVHYFESATRRVYDVKMKEGWSVLK